MSTDIKKVLDELDQAEKVDLDSVDMSLSDDIYAEIMGAQRYQIVGEFHRVKVNAQANRAVGNNQDAAVWDKKMAALKMTVGIIDRDYPRAKATMRRLMESDEAKLAKREKED